jgi:lipopolysaccharide biosynthesis glycosyltransferase
MPNVVFIPNIDLGNNRNDSYKYSIKSWKYWCNIHNCELVLFEDLLVPVEQMKITWQRYYLFDLLEESNIDYNRILMVDADTIVHPDTPNFFDMLGMDTRYCGVFNNGDYEWLSRSIRDFGKLLFKGKKIDTWKYINGGFQIVNPTHRRFFDIMKQYYIDNTSEIISAIDQVKAGTDQTILNYQLQLNNIDVKILPECFNLQDLSRKNLLYYHPNQWWGDTLENLYASGWVYHFNAIPKNPMNRDANYWIKRVYGELYANKQ